MLIASVLLCLACYAAFPSTLRRYLCRSLRPEHVHILFFIPHEASRVRAQAEVDEEQEAGKKKKEAAGQAVRPTVYLCLCKSHYWSTRRIESRSTQQVPVCRCIIYVGDQDMLELTALLTKLLFIFSLWVKSPLFKPPCHPWRRSWMSCERASSRCI